MKTAEEILQTELNKEGIVYVCDEHEDYIGDQDYAFSQALSAMHEYAEQFKTKWQDVSELDGRELSRSWFFIARHGKLIGSSYTLNQVKDYAKSGIATHFFELSLPTAP